MTPPEWRRVEGWLTLEEGMSLQVLARGGKVLELGAYCGRSTRCLAEVAALVVSADWHKGGPDIGSRDTLPEYMSNVRECPNVVPVICCFLELHLILAPRSFGLVFVDGMHDRKSVARDTALALNMVVPGGWIAWHDYGDPAFPGVKAVVDEMAGAIDGRAGNLAWRKFNV